MRIKGLFLVLGVALLVPLSGCFALAASLDLKPGSRLWLEGDSTLHPYSSTATVIRAHIDLQPGPTPTASLSDAIQGHRIEDFEVSIPVKGLRSGESRMDKNMYAALKADKNENIRFHLTGYEITGSSSDAVIHARGRLLIAGMEKDEDLEVQASLSGDEARLRGSKELRMTDFGVKPPTFMFGALKTRDRVVVRFDLLLELKP